MEEIGALDVGVKTKVIVTEMLGDMPLIEIEVFVAGSPALIVHVILPPVIVIALVGEITHS